jgi:hypothetical protein
VFRFTDEPCRNFLKLGKPTANDDAADEQGKRTIFLDIAGDGT